MTTDTRSQVIARHVHLGCWLDDLPGTVTTIRYYQPDRTLVALGDADHDELTAKLGEPRVHEAPNGTLSVWEHPEGFGVETFDPRSAA